MLNWSPVHWIGNLQTPWNDECRIATSRAGNWEVPLQLWREHPSPHCSSVHTLGTHSVLVTYKATINICLTKTFIMWKNMTNQAMFCVDKKPTGLLSCPSQGRKPQKPHRCHQPGHTYEITTTSSDQPGPYCPPSLCTLSAQPMLNQYRMKYHENTWQPAKSRHVYHQPKPPQ
jgi:hypothetical protein